MRRPLALSTLIALAACGTTREQSCDPGYRVTTDSPSSDPRSLAVPAGSSGPGHITFVNSNPVPGASVSGCGPAVGACAGRLKVVLSLKPDVDLGSQRLRVSFFSEDQSRLECSSTTFDLGAGQTFAIEVSCPGPVVDAPTPFRTAKMIAETGTGTSRIEQDWNVAYSFLP